MAQCYHFSLRPWKHKDTKSIQQIPRVETANGDAPPPWMDVIVSSGFFLKAADLANYQFIHTSPKRHALGASKRKEDF